MTQTFEPSLLRAHRECVVESMRSFVAPPETICRTIIGYELGLADRDGAPALTASSNPIRATLCLWAVAASGGDMVAALPIAVSVELIHAFTRIHDDIQYDAQQRYDRDTVLSAWGLGQAVNGGDALHSLALSVLSQGTLEPPVVLRAFQRVVSAVHETMVGNVRALHTTSQPFRTAIQRTGALVGAALEAGAIAGGADERTTRIFRRAGRLLGVALSIREAQETGRVHLAHIDRALAHRCVLRARTLIESCGVDDTWLTHFEEIADYTTSWT